MINYEIKGQPLSIVCDVLPDEIIRVLGTHLINRTITSFLIAPEDVLTVDLERASIVKVQVGFLETIDVKFEKDLFNMILQDMVFKVVPNEQHMLEFYLF